MAEGGPSALSPDRRASRRALGPAMPGPLISSEGDKSGLYGPGESPAHPRWIIKGTYNSGGPPLTGPWLITERVRGDEVHCPTPPPSQPGPKPGSHGRAPACQPVRWVSRGSQRRLSWSLSPHCQVI